MYVRKICSVPLLPSNDDGHIDMTESLGVDEPLVFFTACVRPYDGRLCFHWCVSVQLSRQGVTPSQV